MADFSKIPRHERMALKRVKLKLSPSYIAKYIGISRVTYINWEKGEVTDISWQKLNKLAEVLLTTSEWLEHGTAIESYVFNDENGDIQKSFNGVHVIKSPSIPIFTIDGDADEKPTAHVDMPAKAGNVYALKVLTENKLCRAHVGDALILDANAPLIPGDEIYIKFIKNEAVICVYNYQDDKAIHCFTESGKVIFEKNEITSTTPIIAVARNSQIKNKK